MSKLCGIDKEKGALRAPRALGASTRRLGRWDIPKANALKKRDSRINSNGTNNFNSAGRAHTVILHNLLNSPRGVAFRLAICKTLTRGQRKYKKQHWRRGAMRKTNSQKANNGKAVLLDRNKQRKGKSPRAESRRLYTKSKRESSFFKLLSRSFLVSYYFSDVIFHKLFSFQNLQGHSKGVAVGVFS